MRSLSITLLLVAAALGSWLLTRGAIDAPQRVDAPEPEPPSEVPQARSGGGVRTSEDVATGRTPVPIRSIGAATATPSEFAHDLELTVLLRDVHGAPLANAPLQMTVGHAGERQTKWGEPTDANGRAVIEQVPSRIREAFPTAPLAEIEVTVAVVGMIGTPPSATFRAHELPIEPIELLMPATGSVRVLVEHPDANAEIRGTVRLTERGDRSAPACFTTVEGRAARFRYVGLGLELRASFERSGASSSREVELHGPTAPDQEVVVRIALLDARPVIVARLVLRRLEPFANAELALKMSASSGNSSSSTQSSIHSDADGRVFITLPDEFPRDCARTLLLTSESNGLLVQTELPRPIRDGENDLGDLQLAVPPLLAAGRAVDDAGLPVAKVEVRLAARRGDPANPDGWWWEDVEGGAPKTDAEGRFEARALTDSTMLRVSASAKGYLDPTPVEVATGTTEITLRMQRGGGLTATLLLPRLSTLVWLGATATPVGGGRATTTQTSGTRIAMPSLTPGRVDLAITLFGQHTPSATVLGIPIESGQTTTLEPIDLRTALRAISFTVIDEQGAAIREASALILATRPDTTTRADLGGVIVEDGRGTLVATADPVDVLVFAPHRRLQRVHDLQDGQSIALAAPHEVRIIVPIAALPAPPLRLRAALASRDTAFSIHDRYVLRGAQSSHSTAGALPWDSDLATLVDASGVARLEVPAPGEYDLEWSLFGGPDGARPIVDTALTNTRIVVADTPTPQQFASGITGEIVERARDRR